MKFTDADGNEVDALSQDEADELAENKVAEALQPKEEELATIKTQLAKLENKDFNFKKVRDMNEEEKKSLTAREMALLQRQEKLEEEQNSLTTRILKSYEEEALREFAGDDVETRKKVQDSYGRLSDKAETREEVMNKMKDAAILAGKRTINPLSSLGSIGDFSSTSPMQKKNDTKLTGDQIDLANKLGLTQDDLKKHGYA